MEASSGSEALESEDKSSSEMKSGRIKSFSSLPSKPEVSTVLEESLLIEDVSSLSGSVAAWLFLFLALLPVG